MKRFIPFAAAVCFSSLSMGQNNISLNAGPSGYVRCATTEYMEWMKQQNPGLQAEMDKMEAKTQAWLKNPPPTTNAVTTIPVVFHVVYTTSAENAFCTDARLQQQIDVLNKDYSKTNTDWQSTPAVWQSLVANCQIQFCLASKDPNGNSTSGIIRTASTYTASTWSTNNDVKYTAKGGDDAWTATKYLNIWLCNLGGGLLGYTQNPSALASSPATDGVVIKYTSLPGGTAPYNLGRTATHEIGHWLNLSHIWGDDSNIDGTCGVGETLPAECNGTDAVTDTPNQCDCHYGKPTFPQIDACSSAAGGDPTNGTMFMNYMDYVNDNGMYMFTTGQSQRMASCIFNTRNQLNSASTTKCSLNGIDELNLMNNISLFPNPSTGDVFMTVNIPSISSAGVIMYNAIGESVLEKNIALSANKNASFDMNSKPNGMYFVRIKTSEGVVTKKVIINR